jgi:hypothetical protein
MRQLALKAEAKTGRKSSFTRPELTSANTYKCIKALKLP